METLIEKPPVTPVDIERFGGGGDDGGKDDDGQSGRLAFLVLIIIAFAIASYIRASGG